MRGAGSLTVMVKNAMWLEARGREKASPGVRGLLDVAWWGYLVFGFEGFGIGSLRRDGVKLRSCPLATTFRGSTA